MFKPRIHENGGFCCCEYHADTGAPMPSSTQCDKCKAHFAALGFRAAEEHEGNYAPPNAYEPRLAQLRAAAAPLSTFESDYKAARLRDLQAMRDKLDAEEPQGPPLTTAEELARYAPADPYRDAIRVLKEKEARR